MKIPDFMKQAWNGPCFPNPISSCLLDVLMPGMRPAPSEGFEQQSAL